MGGKFTLAYEKNIILIIGKDIPSVMQVFRELMEICQWQAGKVGMASYLDYSNNTIKYPEIRLFGQFGRALTASLSL